MAAWTVRCRSGRGDNYLGLDVHRAARIAAAGHGGQVLLSDASRALVASELPDGVALRDLGEHRLKDGPVSYRSCKFRKFAATADGAPDEGEANSVEQLRTDPRRTLTLATHFRGPVSGCGAEP